MSVSELQTVTAEALPLLSRSATDQLQIARWCRVCNKNNTHQYKLNISIQTINPDKTKLHHIFFYTQKCYSHYPQFGDGR